MTTRKIFDTSLAFVFTLTLAGVASARRPPALEEAQAKTDAVASTCPEGRSTAGYRDLLARTVTVASTGSVAAVSAPQKSGDHLVLACEGGEVHQGSGYRDFPARLRPETQEMHFATGPRSTSGR